MLTHYHYKIFGEKLHVKAISNHLQALDIVNMLCLKVCGLLVEDNIVSGEIHSNSMVSTWEAI